MFFKIIFSLFLCISIYAKNDLKRYSFQEKLCSVVKQCKLEDSSCAFFKPPIILIKNKKQRCKDLKQLYSDSSFTPSSREARIITILTINPYKIVFKFQDDLNLSVDQFNFLLQHLPFTIKLINIFQNKKYELKYLNPPKNTIWKGKDNVRTSGWASLFLGSFENRNIHYVSYGESNTIFGRFKGNALFNLVYNKKNQNTIKFDLEIKIYTKNSFIYFIFNSWLAKRIIKTQIFEILNDITKSSQKITSEIILQFIQDSTWNLKEKQFIKEFNQLKNK